MEIALRAASAQQAGIEVPDGLAQYVATLPDEDRPRNYRDDRYGLSPQVVDGTLHLWLNDPISQWFGVNNEHLVVALATDSEAPVILHVNSPGGSVFDARAMAATLHGRDVEARVEGVAASAASWLILSAKRRTITVGSQIAVHETSIRFGGCTTEMADLLAVMRAMDAEIAADYEAAAGTGGWLALMQAERGRGTRLGAAKAVELGLVAEVVRTTRPTDDPDNLSTRVDARNRLRFAQAL